MSSSDPTSIEVYLADHPDSTAAAIQAGLGLPSKPNSELYRGLRQGRFIVSHVSSSRGGDTPGAGPPRWSLNPELARQEELQRRLDQILKDRSSEWTTISEMGLSEPKSSLNKLLYKGLKEGRYESQTQPDSPRPYWRLKSDPQ